MEPYFKNDDFAIYNADCMEVCRSMPDNSIDMVLTSPPYKSTRVWKAIGDDAEEDAGERKGGSSKSNTRKNNLTKRYDDFLDTRTDEEYVDDTVALFLEFDRLLKPNCIVLYNISWGGGLSLKGTQVHTDVMHAVFHRTPFYVADTIVWRKANAMPDNQSPNMCTRIWEPVWVCCRASERATFRANKKKSSVRKDNNQQLYEPFYSYIEAANNDGATELNKCTYSTELCDKLLGYYADEEMRRSGGVVFDPYNGTGTTGVSCLKIGMKYIGAEISAKQCEYSVSRLRKPQQGLLF